MIVYLLSFAREKHLAKKELVLDETVVELIRAELFVAEMFLFPYFVHKKLFSSFFPNFFLFTLKISNLSFSFFFFFFDL